MICALCKKGILNGEPKVFETAFLSSEELVYHNECFNKKDLIDKTRLKEVRI